MRHLLAFILLIAASQAEARYLGCTPGGSMRWHDGEPVAFIFDREEEFGPILFGIDLESGEYLEHLVGGRAGISGGGTAEIVDRGDMTSRDDFIGRDRHSYFRIRIWSEPMSFVRIHDDGHVDVGACTETTELMDFARRPPP